MSKHGAGGRDAGSAARLWAFGAVAPCQSPIARSAWPWPCCVCCAARPTCWCSGNCGDGTLPASWCCKWPERLLKRDRVSPLEEGASGPSPGQPGQPTLVADHAAGQLEDWLPIGIGAIAHLPVALLETGNHREGNLQVIESMQVPIGNRPIGEQAAVAAAGKPPLIPPHQRRSKGFLLAGKPGLGRVFSAGLVQPPIGAEAGLAGSSGGRQDHCPLGHREGAPRAPCAGWRPGKAP